VKTRKKKKGGCFAQASILRHSLVCYEKITVTTSLKW